MPHDNINLDQHWLRWWLFAWQHQAIAWTIADFWLVKFCGLNLREISHRNTELLFCTMNLTIMILILLPYFSGSNALYHGPLGNMGGRFGGQCYFNSLAPGKFEWNFRYVSFKQILITNGLEHLLANCPDNDVTGLHWWSVNIGSGNGLVTSGNKPLLEPMLTQIRCHMTSLGHNELNNCLTEYAYIMVCTMLVSSTNLGSLIPFSSRIEGWAVSHKPYVHKMMSVTLGAARSTWLGWIPPSRRYKLEIG